jgi:hypothetical protein
MNKTYTLVDIINHVLSKKEGHLYALNSNYVCYKFLNDMFYGDDIIPRKSRFEESYKYRVDAMIEDIISHIEDKFNIDAININSNPSIGLMVAVAVTSAQYPEDELMEEGLCSEYGKLCYVYNFTHPHLSELGDCFFKRVPTEDFDIIRIG